MNRNIVYNGMMAVLVLGMIFLMGCILYETRELSKTPETGTIVGLRFNPAHNKEVIHFTTGGDLVWIKEWQPDSWYAVVDVLGDKKILKTVPISKETYISAKNGDHWQKSMAVSGN